MSRSKPESLYIPLLKALFMCLCDGLAVKGFRRANISPRNEDISGSSPEIGVCRNHHAFYQQMRITLQKQSVFEVPVPISIGINHQVFSFRPHQSATGDKPPTSSQ